MKKIRIIQLQIKDNSGTWITIFEANYTNRDKLKKIDSMILDDLEQLAIANEYEFREVETTKHFKNIFEYRKWRKK